MIDKNSTAISADRSKKRSLLCAATMALAAFGGAETASACSESPLLGSVCFIATNYCPQGYLPANGQLLQIMQYQALYALFGTTYGGDGRTSFGLPDLRGRSPFGITTATTSGGVPISAAPWGTLRGQETSTLQQANLPPAQGGPAKVSATTAEATTNAPSSTVQLAQSVAIPSGPDPVTANIYAPIGGTQVALGGVSGGGSGGTSAPFTNLPPQIALSACVAWNGVWPTRPD